MKMLDLDMDYFMDEIATINLGLSIERKISGRIVKGHNESLFIWKELIEKNITNTF